MPLKLVTGPANAAKAGEVLGGLRERLAEEPVLVVPTFKDVEHAQRELAERGAIFGAQVVAFDWLLQLIAHRVGLSGRAASEVQCELIVEEAVRRSDLEVLAASAAQPGFARAALRFATELERSMVEPPRFTEAMRRWAGDGPRRAYADEVATVYRRYREGLDAAGLVDEDLFAWRALDALRENPLRWRGTPVFVYGFDDFTRSSSTRSRRWRAAAAPTWSSRCPSSRAGRRSRRWPRATGGWWSWPTRRSSSSRSTTTTTPARAPPCITSSAGCSPPSCPSESTRRRGALHSAGGERAEVELVGAEVLGLLREGTRPGDVAVVFRDPGHYASLVEQVFERLRHPVLDRPRACRCATRRWGAACWRCCAARCWRAPPRTC